MKPSKPTALLILITCFLLFLFSDCKKDGSSIEGFDMYDGTANFMGHVGPVDQDWTVGNYLSAKELAYLDFPMTVSLNHTTEATVSAKVLAFPNPMASLQIYYVTSSDSVVVKLAVVDVNNNVLKTISVKFKTAISFSIDFSDPAVFKDKASLRVYYSFSCAAKQDFKSGYGDIKVCRSSGGNPQSCF